MFLTNSLKKKKTTIPALRGINETVDRTTGQRNKSMIKQTRAQTSKQRRHDKQRCRYK